VTVPDPGPEPGPDPGLRELADRMSDEALHQAQRQGAEWAQLRVARVNRLEVRVRDGVSAGTERVEEISFGLRVLVEGVWGFAAGVDLTPGAAALAARTACRAARSLRPICRDRIELADEPVHTGDWVSEHRIDPFDVPLAEQLATLQEWSRIPHDSGAVDQVFARVWAVREDKFYADTAGTRTAQRRVFVHPMVTAIRLDPAGGFQSQRTLGPPVARGWEYLTGTGWDWAGELSRLPEYLAEQAAARAGRAGRYDLVIDPTNLWLTIHESIGHATELDRILGYETAYAGDSFARPDDLGSLRYGSPVMQVTADRTTDNALATVGFDDEGVAAQSWDLIRDGVLTGFQVDRRTAAAAGLERSNGCAFADSAAHPPLQRMANVSLAPAPDGPGTDELISAVDDGIYVVGDKSWSIDMQRRNFQFTGQRFYRIRHGRLAEPVRDLAYQGSTTEFWNGLEAVGGPQTYLLSGASNCGKAQPLQLAGVSHGCPATLFRDVRVLDTAIEARS
jgi:TldD protein